MKKMISVAAMLSVAAVLALTGCANAAGSSDDDSSEFKILENSSGTLTGTTWLFSDSETKETYTPPADNTGGDESGDEGSDNTGDSGSSDSSNPPASTTEDGIYMHITDDGICYVGEVKYKTKLSGSEYVPDLDTQDTWTYTPKHKGTAEDSNGEFAIALPAKNDTANTRWLKDGDYRSEYSSEGLNSSSVLYKVSSSKLILQTKENDADHSGEYIYTHYNWTSISYKAAMEGPSSEAISITIKNELSGVSLSKTSGIVTTTEKVVDKILSYLTSSATSFAIEGNSGTAYYIGDYNIYQTEPKYNVVTDDTEATFGSISDTTFTLKAVTKYKVSITLSSGLMRDSTESGFDYTKPNTQYKVKWTGSESQVGSTSIETYATSTMTYFDVLKKLEPQDSNDMSTTIQITLGNETLYNGAVAALAGEVNNTKLKTKFTQDTTFGVAEGSSSEGSVPDVDFSF